MATLCDVLQAEIDAGCPRARETLDRIAASPVVRGAELVDIPVDVWLLVDVREEHLFVELRRRPGGEGAFRVEVELTGLPGAEAVVIDLPEGAAASWARVHEPHTAVRHVLQALPADASTGQVEDAFRETDIRFGSITPQ